MVTATSTVPMDVDLAEPGVLAAGPSEAGAGFAIAAQALRTA
jgi:hypothetical protein